MTEVTQEHVQAWKRLYEDRTPSYPEKAGDLERLLTSGSAGG